MMCVIENNFVPDGTLYGMVLYVFAPQGKRREVVTAPRLLTPRYR